MLAENARQLDASIRIAFLFNVFNDMEPVPNQTFGLIHLATQVSKICLRRIVANEAANYSRKYYCDQR